MTVNLGNQCLGQSDQKHGNVYIHGCCLILNNADKRCDIPGKEMWPIGQGPSKREKIYADT